MQVAGRFNKHVVVVGSARSGTSWLSETLAQPFRYRMLFEPEQETRTKKGYLLCDKWLEEANDSIGAHKYLTQLLKNKVDCDWIAQNSNRKFKLHLWPFVPKKFIIKFVRFNLSALYMHKVFGVPVVHIIRNPYDVIRSQQQVKFPWLYDLSHFVKQDKLVNLILEVFNYDIREFHKLSDVEVLALRWCIENVIPNELNKDYSKEVEIVRYEDLIQNTDVFYKLCDTLKLEAVDNLEQYYKQPSSKTHPKSYTYNKDNNKSEFSEATLVEINKMLDVFKTTLYKRRN